MIIFMINIHIFRTIGHTMLLMELFKVAYQFDQISLTCPQTDNTSTKNSNKDAD